MNAILKAHDLARFYEVRRGYFSGEATVKALAGVSFSLEPGKTLAVVGESGCGKSTLARLLTMIETPTAGSLDIDGKDVTQTARGDRKALRRAIQIVFQNPYGSLNRARRSRRPWKSRSSSTPTCRRKRGARRRSR